jgi:hypothetical protein
MLLVGAGYFISSASSGLTDVISLSVMLPPTRAHVHALVSGSGQLIRSGQAGKNGLQPPIANRIGKVPPALNAERHTLHLPSFRLTFQSATTAVNSMLLLPN